MTGLIAGFLVGDGFVGAAAASAVAGAETSAVAVAAAGASATGAGASIVFASALVSPDSASCLTTGVGGAPNAAVKASGIAATGLVGGEATASKAGEETI